MENFDSQKIKFANYQKDWKKILYKWLNTEELIKAYGGNTSMKNIESFYGSRITREDDVYGFFILYGVNPIGYIQMHKLIDSNETNGLSLTNGSIDYFIGEPEYKSIGMESIMIKKFLREVNFNSLQVKYCSIIVNLDDINGHRVYTDAGFKEYEIIKDDQNNPVASVFVVTQSNNF